MHLTSSPCSLIMVVLKSEAISWWATTEALAGPPVRWSCHQPDLSAVARELHWFARNAQSWEVRAFQHSPKLPGQRAAGSIQVSNPVFNCLMNCVQAV
ncbi:hypothetical protein V8F06_007222 [Rhypophila decipiens]